MNGMGIFAFFTLVISGAFTIHFCLKRTYKLGYNQCVLDMTAELERLRDELLESDAGSYVRSL